LPESFKQVGPVELVVKLKEKWSGLIMVRII